MKEFLDKQEILTKAKNLCEGCYLMEHCGQCNLKCRLRQAIDMIEESSSPSMPMTPEEAIIELDCLRVGIEQEEQSHECSEALEMAIEALNKQIPRPLKKDGDFIGELYLCRICGEPTGNGKYCQWCGQRIGG